MPGFVREHLRPLAGSAALHLLLIALIGGMALRWTTSQPPQQLAIEGVVVDARDLPKSVRENRAIREPRSAPEPAPEPAPRPKPATPPPPDPAAEALQAERARAAEQQRQADARREAAQARERAEAVERDARREQAARDKVAAEKAAAEKAAAAKAAADKAAKDKAAREKAEQERVAKQQAADEARARAAREAEVRRALAAEEEEMAATARSGVQDEYRALLSQAIERSWLKPPSARAGLACTLYVTQVPGGAVTDVRLGSCNGDEAVRESIVNAVYRASPLPPPRDPRAFERRLEIVFRPKE